ncbi:hypothetical protein GCM10022225_35610 [Plantactinospora mayteni]|uniref:Uncharacterized protein n=1 Tax=Plantactinospora mayteni TaxID=566021 RepID=A0ABQ4EME2_9ACTN|nr:hypothetical protein Pma05_24010 [Plantactinospora mayteni]
MNRNGRNPAGPDPAGAAGDPVRGVGVAGVAAGAKGCAGGIARLYVARRPAPGVSGRTPNAKSDCRHGPRPDRSAHSGPPAGGLA